MSEQYERQLRIWVVGVRGNERNGSAWGELWKPTGREWFSTRKECKEYIKRECASDWHKHMEYKPLLYAQVRAATPGGEK